MASAFFANWRQNIIYIGFVVIFIVFAATLADKGFLNPNNLLNIVRQTAMIAMAIAMTFVLSAGEIDLSVGAVAGLSTVTVAMAIAVGGPFVGVLAGLATGPRRRCVQWLAHHAHRHSVLPDHARDDGHRQGRRDVDLRDGGCADPLARYSWLFGGGNVGPVPVLLLWMVILGAIGQIVLRRTGFGRRVLATGGGETAARWWASTPRRSSSRCLSSPPARQRWPECSMPAACNPAASSSARATNSP